MNWLSICTAIRLRAHFSSYGSFLFFFFFNYFNSSLIISSLINIIFMNRKLLMNCFLIILLFWLRNIRVKSDVTKVIVCLFFCPHKRMKEIFLWVIKNLMHKYLLFKLVSHLLFVFFFHPFVVAVFCFFFFWRVIRLWVINVGRFSGKKKNKLTIDCSECVSWIKRTG